MLSSLIDEYRDREYNDAISHLNNYINSIKKQRDNYLKAYQEFNKDEEIQKLKQEIEELKAENREKRKGYTYFVIEPEENKAIKEWIEKHINEKHNGNRYAGTIGGQFTYSFLPTSIGEAGYVTCSCGEEFDFRDIE